MKQIIRFKDYLKLIVIEEQHKLYFIRSKRLQNVKYNIESNIVHNNMIHANDIITTFNYITGLSKLDTVTPGKILSAWIWLIALSLTLALLSTETKI